MDKQKDEKASKSIDENNHIKIMQVVDIEIHPVFSKIYKMSIKTLNRIKIELDKYGLDKGWVLPVYKIGDRHILATEQYVLEVVKKAGIEDIMVRIMEFNNFEEAFLYYYKNKNPSATVILKETEILMGIDRQKKGEGRAADIIALRLGVSPSTIYQALYLLRNKCKKSIDAINRGHSTIKNEYLKYHPKKTDRLNININSSVKIKDIIYLLLDAGYESASKYLIKAFTKE